MAARFADPRAAAFRFTGREEGRLKAKGVLGDPNRAYRGVNQSTYDAFRGAHGLPSRDVAQASDYEIALIYDEYWRRWRCPEVATYSGALAVCYFDCVWNGGGAQVLGMTEGEPAPDNTLSVEELAALPKILAAGEDAAVTAFLQNRLSRFQRLRNPAAEPVWESRLNRLAAYVGVSWRVPGSSDVAPARA